MIIGNRLSRNRAHMRWIDTHCHLDAAEFAADRTAVWQRACAAGVTMAVIPAVAADTFDAVRGLAHELGLAYALGIHPLCVDRAAYEDLDRLRDALQRHADDPRLVAVGEIGLDWFVPGLDRERQQAFYLAQIPGPLPSLLVSIGFLRSAIFDEALTEPFMDAVIAGYRMGKDAAPFFGVQWDALWNVPIDEVRRRLRVMHVTSSHDLPVAA